MTLASATVDFPNGLSARCRVARKISSPAYLAKLTRPRLTDVLLRERLFRRLDDRRHSVIWISGPPGAGKTTLGAATSPSGAFVIFGTSSMRATAIPARSSTISGSA